MRIENPAAYRFIIDEDLYLLNADKVNLPVSLTTIKQPVVVEQVMEPIIAVVETPVINFKYMGGHKKSFLIIVHYPGHEFMADEHLTALTNILKRKELTIDDVAILNLAGQSGDFAVIVDFFKPQKLLLMGKNALPAGVTAPTQHQLANTGNVGLLYSFSFDEMMSSNNNKKIFWDQMKNL